MRQRIIVLAATLALATTTSACLVPEMEARCDSNWDCGQCLEESGCGYCDDFDDDETGRCLPGTSFGPDVATACPDAKWRFDSCYSPPDILGCSAYEDWSSCAAFGSDCKWCETTGECIRDDSSCPDGPGGDGGVSGNCDFESCAACLANDSGCTWCVGATSYCSADVCQTGGGGLAYYNGCPQPCSSYDSCWDCGQDPACVYCWQYEYMEGYFTERCSDNYSCPSSGGYCTDD